VNDSKCMNDPSLTLKDAQGTKGKAMQQVAGPTWGVTSSKGSAISPDWLASMTELRGMTVLVSLTCSQCAYMG